LSKGRAATAVSLRADKSVPEAMPDTGSTFGPSDPKIEAMIATKRAMEAARLQRIKDPKSRVMGIDTQALAQQVAEKHAAARLEKDLAAEYDTQRLQQDAMIAFLEQERLRAERTKQQYVAQFNQTELARDKRREWDLNDPLAKKKELPARVGDMDPRMSVSNLQAFHGEDLTHAHRVKVQQQEIKAWMDEATALKAAQKARERAMDDAFARQAIEIDQMKSGLEATCRSAATMNAVAQAEYNLAMAAAKREREAAMQKAELQDNVVEIQANLASDLLTENPAVGRSFVAPNRLRPDHYKGMAPDEQAAFRDALTLQSHQKAALAEMQKQEKQASEAAMEYDRLQGAYQDAQVASMRAMMRKKIQQDNLKLQEQQFASKVFLKKNVYTNSIDTSFYDQFGTSSR